MRDGLPGPGAFTGKQRQPSAAATAVPHGRTGGRSRGRKRESPGRNDSGYHELSEARGEDVHPALASVYRERPAGYAGGGLQKHVRKIWKRQRGFHQQRPRLRLRSLGMKKFCFIYINCAVVSVSMYFTYLILHVLLVSMYGIVVANWS